MFPVVNNAEIVNLMGRPSLSAATPLLRIGSAGTKVSLPFFRANSSKLKGALVTQKSRQDELSAITQSMNN